MEQISQIDLAFCVDVTTSMTGLLNAARARMLDILNGLQLAVEVQLRVAVVAYQDYRQLDSRPVKVHPFRDEPEKMRDDLNKLRIVANRQNSDAAEAVFAGLLACVNDLKWRPKAARVLILAGDAPPHGCGAIGSSFPDRYNEGDPTGETLMSMASKVEAGLITLHALGMIPSVIPDYDKLTEETFSFLAQTTGGTYRTVKTPKDAMAVVEAIGRREFGQIELDRRLWDQLTGGDENNVPASVEAMLPDLEESLQVPLVQLHEGVARLRKRGILPAEKKQANSRKRR